MKGLRAIPKVKNVHLPRSEKKVLRKVIFERDHDCCVICGKKAEHWHHQPFGSNKSDEISKGVALCKDCHDTLHNNPKIGKDYEAKVIAYLWTIYGDNN